MHAKKEIRLWRMQFILFFVVLRYFCKALWVPFGQKSRGKVPKCGSKESWIGKVHFNSQRYLLWTSCQGRQGLHTPERSMRASVMGIAVSPFTGVSADEETGKVSTLTSPSYISWALVHRRTTLGGSGQHAFYNQLGTIILHLIVHIFRFTFMVI